MFRLTVKLFISLPVSKIVSIIGNSTYESKEKVKPVAYAKAAGYIVLAKNSADISMMKTAQTIRPYLKVAPL